MIDALNDDKVESSSPQKETEEVIITGATEHASGPSMKEQDEKQKKAIESAARVKAEIDGVHPKARENRPLRIVFPGTKVPIPLPESVLDPSLQGSKVAEEEHTGLGDSSKSSKGKKSKKRS